MFKDYVIWKQLQSENQWTRTHHVVKARTDKEADSKMKRMFANCGFSCMSLVAFPSDKDPNCA